MRYNRSLFRFDSAKARRILLKRSNGVLLDVYNGRLLESESDFDAEHVVPLYNAWNDGFKLQYAIDPVEARNKMIKFANDPRNLVIVGKSSNRSRGAKTLWNWVPLCLAYVPVRNATVRELYAEYGLKLGITQQWAMDWADKKILHKHKHGIHMGKVRA